MICRDLNRVFLLLDECCTPTSCPEMKVKDNVYLCYNHIVPASCSAIDFASHCLDKGAATLNSSIFTQHPDIPEAGRGSLIDMAHKFKLVFEHGRASHSNEFCDAFVEDLNNRLLKCIELFFKSPISSE